MKPLAEARAEVLSAMPRLGSGPVDAGSSVGRVTARPALAREHVPPFDNSAMDGFAVIAADVAQAPRTLRVIEDVAAGSVPVSTVVPGTAVRIMTSAPMPSGADAVVRGEDTEAVGRDEVIVAVSVEEQHNVRPRGGDMSPGDVIVESGIKLTARHAAGLASAGIVPVVSDMPAVAVISTGDEVVPYTTRDLAPGTIRDSNRVLLRAVLA